MKEFPPPTHAPVPGAAPQARRSKAQQPRKLPQHGLAHLADELHVAVADDGGLDGVGDARLEGGPAHLRHVGPGGAVDPAASRAGLAFRGHEAVEQQAEGVPLDLHACRMVPHGRDSLDDHLGPHHVPERRHVGSFVSERQ